jgi:pimeloyl-ACP methyl ester carboxylesterase
MDMVHISPWVSSVIRLATIFGLLLTLSGIAPFQIGVDTPWGNTALGQEDGNNQILSSTFAKWALLFDGVDDYVTIPDARNDFDFTTRFTFEAWIRPDTISPPDPDTPYETIARASYGYPEPTLGFPWQLFKHFSTLIFSITDMGQNLSCDSPQTPVGTLIPGQWQHVAVTYDGSKITIYWNGNPVASSPCSGNLGYYGGTGAIYLGNSLASGGSRPLNGAIDEVRVWNIPRSQGQITAHKNSVLAGSEVGLVGNWSFNNYDPDEFQIITDGSIRGNHGYLGSSQYTDAHDPLWVASQALIDTRLRTPLVFIPGIMGSNLLNGDHLVWADPEDLVVWEDLFVPDLLYELIGFWHPLHVLRLAEDGRSPLLPAYKNVQTIQGISGVLTRIKGWALGVYPVDEDEYETVIQHFLGQGYRENVDFWAFPYDWRKDLRLAAGDLNALIESIVSQTGHSQVYIVAHSMGGLVARQYISHADYQANARLRKAVFLGTPFLGAPKAFYTLQRGVCQKQVEIVGLKWFCVPNRVVVKELVKNYPGFYALLPSEAYFKVKGGGFYGEGTDIEVAGKCPQCLSFNETYTLKLLPNLNILAMRDARLFHEGLDYQIHWNGVPVSIIAGRGQETIVGIKVVTAPARSAPGSAPDRPGCPYIPGATTCASTSVYMRSFSIPVITRAGDETVPLMSASLQNQVTGINLRGNASFTSFPADHMGLVQKPEILAYVDALLNLSVSTSSMEAMLLSQSIAAGEYIGAQIVARGVKSIEVHDSLGNRTGPAEENTLIVEQSIPGSTYLSDIDLHTVALEGGQTYTIKVTPLGELPVDITLIRSTDAETVSTTLYLGIPAEPQSTIILSGDPYVAELWHLHVEGEEPQPVAPTITFSPGDLVDSTPPNQVQIELQGSLASGGGWYASPVTVTLSASDDPTGSGISRIEYTFSNDGRVYTYTGPFVADPQIVGMLYAAAVDGFGNYQAEISQARIGPERIYLPITIQR